MNKLSLVFLAVCILFIAACSNSDTVGSSGNSEEENEINHTISNESLLESGSQGIWVDYDGVEKVNDKYTTTDFIDISDLAQTQLNVPAYVSYFNENEFLETKKYLENVPVEIDNVDKASKIKLSLETKHFQEKEAILNVE